MGVISQGTKSRSGSRVYIHILYFSTGLSNTSASNGNFGFGNPVNKTDADDSDFADFSSAFGGPSSDSNKTNIDQNLFKTDSAIPAPPSPQGATADVDLFGISSNNSNVATNGNNSSGLGDLLGLSSGSDNLTSMPNLMNAPQMSSQKPRVRLLLRRLRLFN